MIQENVDHANCKCFSRYSTVDKLPQPVKQENSITAYAGCKHIT